MNKLLCLFTAAVMTSAAYADVAITDGGKYRIESAYYGSSNGAVVLGSYHDAVPYLYYVTYSGSNAPDDGWWTITKDGKGYTIANAITGQYMVYSSTREQNTSGVYASKGITLANSVSGDEGRWTITQYDDSHVYFCNVAYPQQYFNLRTDGSYLLGTYAGLDGDNCYFTIYGEDDKNIISGESSSSSGSGSSGESGSGSTTGDPLTGTLATYADSIRINGKDLIYDSSASEYYAPLPQATIDEASTTLNVYLKTKLTDGTYTVSIDGVKADDSGNITLSGVSGQNASTIQILKNNTAVASATLNFTFMPIVEVTASSCSANYYTTGSIRVTDPDVAGYDSTYIAAYKYRGATASGKPKKSYAIKLRDSNGNSVDHKFLDLREDNNWILDAAFIDGSCMRNRVSTDLWNDFSTKPYHRTAGYEKKARNGTRGKFVEVFLNGSYHGLYCMTEKLDRKQLKLKKFVEATKESNDTIHGTLYKSYDWGYEVFMGHNSDSQSFPKTAPSSYASYSKSETWKGYEVKYPDYEDEVIDWGPLWNAINFVATSDDDTFDSGISEWFDFPVLKDYYLLIELILATDNHGKNMFFYNYDVAGTKNAKKLGIAPWDLDGTWGARWNGTETITKPSLDFNNFLWSYEHGQHTIYYRLQNSSYWNWEQQLATRYAELRGKEFAEDALIKRFTDYADLFAASGADARETAAWGTKSTTSTGTGTGNGFWDYNNNWVGGGSSSSSSTELAHTDIPGDVDYITGWISDRLAYLDEQYGYDPTATSISNVQELKSYASAVGGNGCIRIHATQPTTVKVYTIGGVLLRTVELTQPITFVEGLAAGVYIVGDSKVIVK